jgi:hypothetical protein
LTGLPVPGLLPITIEKKVDDVVFFAARVLLNGHAAPDPHGLQMPETASGEVSLLAMRMLVFGARLTGKIELAAHCP